MRAASTETKLLRIEMLRRGLSDADVAKLTGYSVRMIRSQFSLSFASSDPAKWEIEAKVLHYEVPIWSSQRTLLLRKRAADILSFDPFLFSRPEVMARARTLGLEVHRDCKLQVIREAILEYIANKTPNTMGK